jgi:hypothetical protein
MKPSFNDPEAPHPKAAFPDTSNPKKPFLILQSSLKLRVDPTIPKPTSTV